MKSSITYLDDILFAHFDLFTVMASNRFELVKTALFKQDPRGGPFSFIKVFLDKFPRPIRVLDWTPFESTDC